jgi:hypothetical protein
VFVVVGVVMFVVVVVVEVVQQKRFGFHPMNKHNDKNNRSSSLVGFVEQIVFYNKDIYHLQFDRRNLKMIVKKDY